MKTQGAFTTRPERSTYDLEAHGLFSPYRLAFWGDSITLGNGDVTNGGMRKGVVDGLTTDLRPPRCVGTLIDGSFTENNHDGHSGFWTTDILRDMDGWLEFGRPDIVLLQIGTNDCATSLDIPNLPARIGMIVDRIHRWRSRCWVSVSTIPPTTNSWSGVASTLNAAIPGIVSARTALGKRVHNSTAGSDCSIGNLQGDGTHPAPAGYAQMAVTRRADVNLLLNMWT